ncbi:hypothetical protein Lser_V15G11500 [Lactuca serriola]
MHQSNSMEESNQIMLLGTAASPYVNRVQFVLNLKSIKYEFIEENLACKSDLLLASNPVLKKVPVLLQANKPPLCESLIIIDYLEDIYPNVHKLLPSDPLDRAIIRFWANYMDNEVLPLYEKLRCTPHKEGKEAIIKQIIEESSLIEKTHIKFSNGKSYFGGEDVGYLDVVFGSFIGWTRFVENHYNFKIFDRIRTPNLVEWAERMTSHEDIKDVIPREETLMNFYMMIQEHKKPRVV